MSLPPATSRLPSLWSSLRRPDCGIGPRLLASLTTALVFAGLAYLAAWIYALHWNRRRIDDRFLNIAIGVAAACWVPLQIWIWIAGVRGVRIGRTIVATILVWAAVIPAHIKASEWYWSTGWVLKTAIVLLASGLTLLLWSPVVLRLMARRALTTREGYIDVRCPQCNYLLIGLRELRCPECGTEFTIDGLIRAQRFAIPQTLPADGAQTRPQREPVHS